MRAAQTFTGNLGGGYGGYGAAPILSESASGTAEAAYGGEAGANDGKRGTEYVGNI